MVKTKILVSALLLSLAAGCGAAPAIETDGSVNVAAAATPLKPDEVLASMKKVAGWQMAHPSSHSPTDWTQGVYYTGMMALYDVSKTITYRDAMRVMGQKNGWQPGSRIYHADDHLVCQTYCDLYFLDQDASKIAPTKQRFNTILQNPKTGSLAINTKGAQDRWAWCDALFMAPGAWARLYAATGDKRYLDFMNKEWWATTDYLYDPVEHLFFRDSSFFNKTSPNGRKVFWSRGNGWVYAGLVRVLMRLPATHPDHDRYIKLFREMTTTIVRAQQADGLWRPNLLDPNAVPQGETSGSGLFVYGLTWGINHHLVDAATYWPVASRGWTALVGKVHSDGKLGAVQPIGAAPGPFTDDSTEVYGTGAFLLAGSEIYKHLTATASTSLSDSTPLSDSTQEATTTPAPTTPAPAAPTQAPVSTQPATWCRFVPERLDDFAWENDLTAFRAYGPAIKTTKGTEDSGLDCWLKRVKYPIIDKWYAGDPKGISYHEDHGEGNDPYHVGSSRGTGGLAIWKDGKMLTAGPYKTWKIITRTTEKSVFELTYHYNVDGATIHEVKRITIELGKRLYNAESTFTKDGKPVALDIAIGITTHDGLAKATLDPKHGWMSCWEKMEGYGLGTGVVIAPAKVISMSELKSKKADESHALLLTKTDAAGKVSYFAGYGWEKAGEITTPEKWQAYLTQFAAASK